MASATEIMDMDVTKLSEMEFRVTMVKMMSRIEKSINKNVTENIESLRTEMRANLTEIENSRANAGKTRGSDSQGHRSRGTY